MIASYSDLKTRLADWLSRTDLSTQIDDAISLFEAEIVDVLPSRENMTSDTVNASGQEVSLPTDLLELKGVTIDGRSATQLGEAAARDLYGTSTGNAVAFSYDGGSSIKLWPSPASEQEVLFSYVSDLVGLSSDNATNWLIEKHPHIYLYGTMRHLAHYQEDMERKAAIEPDYQSFLAQLLKAQIRRRLAGAVVRLQGSTP